jgi:RNA polymerase sigma-70 factor (ECF subfamily)
VSNSVHSGVSSGVSKNTSGGTSDKVPRSTQATRLERAHPESSGGAPDEVLAQAARRDPQAFAELYARYVERIYRYHLIRTGSVQDAQDLTSQTFLAALESIASYRGQASFGGWLFGIASHKVADHYRRRRTHLDLERAEELDDPGSSPEQVVAMRQQMARVAEALQSLAPEQAEALTLRIYGELTAAEIGRVVNKSEAAVKMMVHRGLCKLREKLALNLEVSQ